MNEMMSIQDAITNAAEREQLKELAKKFWMYMTFGVEQSPLDEADLWALTRIQIAQQFPGWTLDYIDGLSRKDLVNIIAVLEAQNKLERKDEKKEKPLQMRMIVGGDIDKSISAIAKSVL